MDTEVYTNASTFLHIRMETESNEKLILPYIRCTYSKCSCIQNGWEGYESWGNGRNGKQYPTYAKSVYTNVEVREIHH
jgi:hypothetical protein